MIPAAGDVYLADVNEEQRRRVLVLSDARFHRATQRAIVAPSTRGVAVDPSPWRPGADEMFAVDFLRTLALDRLVEPAGRVDAATLRRAQRAVVMSL